MSEQPTGTAQGRPAQGKKILGMKRGTAIGVGVVGLVVVVILVIRARSKASSGTATTASTAAGGSCPDGSTPDANGNCPQDSQDFSGQLATLESEIAALQGAGSGGSAGGGSAGTVGAATGTTTTPATNGTTTATTTPTTTAATPKAVAGPISNLQATSTGTTTATIRWNPAQGATGGYQYQYAAVGQGEGTPRRTQGVTATLTGLKPKTTYNFGIQALPGGPGNNIHFTTK